MRNKELSRKSSSLRSSFAVTALVVGLAMPVGALGSDVRAILSRPRGNSAAISDCSVIQAALDRLSDGGGLVLLGARTYVCQTAIVINRDHVTLRGLGPATKLTLAAGANSPVIVIGDTNTPPGRHRNIQVSDLYIDGNRSEQTMECWSGPCDGPGLAKIRNNGITIRGVDDVVVERVTTKSAISGGVVIELVSNRVMIRNLTAFDNAFDGLAAYLTRDSVFEGLQLHGNQFAGLSFDTGFNDNIVADSVIAENGKVGIFMRDSQDNLFSNIQIRDNGEHGVFLAQLPGRPETPAAGNTFNNLVISRNQGAAIWVADPTCVNNTVNGSQFIENTSEFCIFEAAEVAESGNLCRQL